MQQTTTPTPSGARFRYVLAILISGILLAAITGVIVYRRSGLSVSAQVPMFVAPSNELGWKQDLHYMTAEIPRRHINAFHTLTRAQFDRVVSELDSAIPTLDKDQIVVGLMRITTMLGDGHTRIAIPPNFHSFPLEAYWFGNTLRVTKVAPQYRRALGTRVVQIEDTSIEDAYKAIRTLIPQGENDLWVRRFSPLFLVCAELLHGLRILPIANRGRYMFEDDTGNRFWVDLEPLPESQREADELRWLSAAKIEPLYMQQPNKDVWFSYLEANQTAFFKFNRAPGYWDFYRFSQRLLEVMDHRPVRRLVIDLRHNQGGDFTKIRWLFLPKLVERRYRRQCFACPREINRPSHLYVVIGRETYSAGVMNALELRDEASALLVGEPTGGRPNAYGEDRSFTLPNSHLVVSVSTRYYRLVQENTASLLPDQEIDLSWPDFLVGRDPVLEWVLAQPEDP